MAAFLTKFRELFHIKQTYSNCSAKVYQAKKRCAVADIILSQLKKSYKGPRVKVVKEIIGR